MSDGKNLTWYFESVYFQFAKRFFLTELWTEDKQSDGRQGDAGLLAAGLMVMLLLLVWCRYKLTW